MIPTAGRLEKYFAELSDLTTTIVATMENGTPGSVADVVDWTVSQAISMASRGGKVMFVGNGGSAAIASHMAIDFSKNGNIPAIAFNDGASLTCLANDLGFEEIFAHHVRSLGKHDDLLIAISSSGASPNIIAAAKAARLLGMSVLTLSAFSDQNPLRRLGDRNLYVPTSEYGFAELIHLSLCHAILDLTLGWQPGRQK